ncbi:phosphoribosylformimino-5-aminoimidazole carboxamide ribotide isomerase [Mariniblastus fucicola]|uniref:1-(5-phosphoribosyl)-5-[(5-phosphoribosylamino)methylideneamino] imidazole-4-carboxamide isomerase n=1 Tax=Mariniblastus fucicola TaxID=980251 RepID=A0A5B9P7Z1_9BACT|nr:phosphoribosylformimino-5-aminoimidazole carboxamide ribotide isomerase [Mariniblastus fucicola]QEG21082.1 1-(5-phosphoribosyl)-5-[(5-phosphoribosylamino)methylideneamino] imidazole-4-carboxamide isomerase [Mariniblastus fucicola]
MTRPKSRFRPCIDLHHGKVKQIVGSTIEQPDFQENFVSEKPAQWYAAKFRDDELVGGHVIMLGPGNADAARSALSQWPGGLQVGGGITIENGQSWIEAGASHVIVTSWLFDGPTLDWERVRSFAKEVGSSRIVIDLSCRRAEGGWRVATNRWQTVTDVNVSIELLERLAPYCSEFLVHAADVEGKCDGVDRELVELLSGFENRKLTYAGGVACMDDLLQIDSASQGRLDVTVGSALDLFGGFGLRYSDLVKWNREAAASEEV